MYVHPQVGCVQKLEEVDAQVSTGRTPNQQLGTLGGLLENVLEKLFLA